jgi:hypothetical protein
LAFGDLALEVAEGEVVIVNLDGEAFDAGVLGNSFGYSPALVYPFLFQAEIEVVRSSMMLLDYKSRHFHRFLTTGDVPRAFRLSRLLYDVCRMVAIKLGAKASGLAACAIGLKELTGYGVRPGDRLALGGEVSEALVFLFIGVTAAGAV